MRKTMRWILLLLLLVISGRGACFAQSTNSGDIRGTVTDTTGALIPNVKVEVLNVETGVDKVFTTNNDGIYDTSSIVAGNYKVTFSRDGFETLVRGPITVDVGLTGLNAQLKVGSATVQVTVDTDVPLLHTETGDQTSTLEKKEMAELPNPGGGNGPDWQNFMILLPGAVGTSGGNQGAANPGQEVSTNGNMPYSNVLADGASTTLPSSQNANPAVFDDIEELQVSLSTFSAQYGVGGMVINQITKGGTSRFHGSAYEYFENNALNAAGYRFNNSPTAAGPNGTKVRIAPGFQRYDDFGGTVGGPIALPKLNHKAFFFFGYDQIINHGVAASFQTIPTTTVMAGQFTTAPAGDTPWPIYDPTTQTVGTDSKGNLYPIRKTFAQEYGTNAIPAKLFDSVSANFQKFYPTSANTVSVPTTGTINAAGVTTNNFYTSDPNPNNWRRYFGRLDYDITPTNRLTLSDTQADEIETAGQSGRVADCPVGCQQGDVDNNNSQISDVWNINSKTVNELRLAYTDQLNFFEDSSTGLNYPTQLGWQFSKANILPGVDFERNYPYAWIQPATNAVYKEHVYDPSDVVTMILGKHILHFGGEFAFYRDNDTSWGNINAGTLQFNGSYTEGWDHASCGSGAYADQVCPNTSTGEEYADFLLGYSSNWSAGVSPEYGARLTKPQMFVQDDWKLRPNLTVNLGIRYEISHGFSEVKGNEATFDPTLTNTANNTLGAYWFGETSAGGRSSLQANVYSTFLPRLGVSWSPKPNTTVRGGVGLYSYNWSTDNYGSGLGASVQSTGSYGDGSNGIYPVTKFSGAGTLFPLGINAGAAYGAGAPLPYTTSNTSPTRFNGSTGPGYNDYHTPIPKIYQWNFSLERQLSSRLAGTLSYVGSHGYNLAFPTDVNAVPLSALAAGNQNTCGSGTAVGCARPYNNFSGSIGGNIYNAISNYHSLQATITQHLTQGLSFSFNYVWSHLLDDQDSSGWGSHSGPQNYQYATTLTQNETSKNYSNSNFDVRQAFKGYVVYQLPFGKGRQFLNKNAILDEAVGGWEFAGTIVALSGNPFSVFGTNNTYQGAGSQFPNWVSGVSPYASGKSGKCAPGVAPNTGGCKNTWVNPAAFSDPAPGTFGNVRRNSLVGPGVQYENLSGVKSFALPWEGIKFVFRVDASNVFNHASFSSPSAGLGSPNATTQVFTTVNPTQITGTTEGGRVVQLTARVTF
jgi:hypothetical protein